MPNVKVKYLVTTQARRVHKHAGSFGLVAMVDGTVPEWPLGHYDLHYDHHRSGGADIQVEEMGKPGEILDRSISDLQDDWTITTTQLDADACVAAAWLQLTSDTPECILVKLRAIAYDCDHLGVPQDMQHLAGFAAKAVASLKSEGFKLADQLGLPKDGREWSEAQREEYYSLGFQQGTEWLIAAALDERPWPGESGEADEYFQQVEDDAAMLISANRVGIYRGCGIYSTKGLGRYVDPRAAVAAIRQVAQDRVVALDAPTLAVRDHKGGGNSYTLGVIPMHCELDSLDYTDRVWAVLTDAEKSVNSSAEGWGGRRTVGGSGWNTPSQLTPQEVIDIVLSLE